MPSLRSAATSYRSGASRTRTRLAARAVAENDSWTWQVADGSWLVAARDLILIVEFEEATPVIVTVYPARPGPDEIAA